MDRSMETAARRLERVKMHLTAPESSGLFLSPVNAGTLTIKDSRTDSVYEVPISDQGTVKASEFQKIKTGGDVPLRLEDSGRLLVGAAAAAAGLAVGFLSQGDKASDASSGAAPVTKAEILEVQDKWGSAIKRISMVYKTGGDYVKEAASAAGELYAYGHSEVLFKPTKATDNQFRPTPEEAMSYFVGGKAVADGYKEDGGFAINGGKGWKQVVHDNHKIVLKGSIGLAMGNYFFTCSKTEEVSKVEYTFGYMRCTDGKVRIFLHHSSVPYSPHPAPVTRAEVVAVQDKWAAAIKRISKVYKTGGDYIKEASAAASELYAYGHSAVLFKPTKAAKHQFRPTAEEAMSYFVGGKVVAGGYDEDAGFAINGGKGWEKCEHDNHKIELVGDIGLAMGNYYFTDMSSGDVSKVEYTFGYKRCSDEKVRIFLHHSSVPYGPH